MSIIDKKYMYMKKRITAITDDMTLFSTLPRRTLFGTKYTARNNPPSTV